MKFIPLVLLILLLFGCTQGSLIQNKRKEQNKQTAISDSEAFNLEKKKIDHTLSKEIVGGWHAYPITPSGHAEWIDFYADGTYVKRSSTMVGDSRIRNFSGKYLIMDNWIEFTKEYQTEAKGGTIVDAYASFAPAYKVLENPELIKVQLNDDQRWKSYYHGINDMEIDLGDSISTFTTLRIDDDIWYKFEETPRTK